MTKTTTKQLDKLAVISFKGKQYFVKEGDKIKADKHVGEKNVTVSDVLFVQTDQNATVGTPVVEKATVEMERVEDKKDPKIRIFKYKSKSRYRRSNNHRQEFSYFTVKAIKA